MNATPCLSRPSILGLAIAAVAVGLASQASAQSTDAEVLRYKFSKDTYTIRGQAKREGGSTNANIEAELSITHSLKEATKEPGVSLLSQAIETIKIDMEMPGMGTMKFDSESGKGDPLIGAMAQQLITTKDMAIHERGKVVQGPKFENAAMAPMKGFLGGSVLPFEFLQFPEKGLKVGDTWTHENKTKAEDESGARTMKLKFTYTLTRITERDGDKIAAITYTIVVDKGSFKASGGKGEVKLAEGKGKASFNITKGHLRKLEHTILVERTEEDEAGGLQELKEKLRLKLTRKDDAKGS